MLELVLGFILGAGVVLAVQTVAATITTRRAKRQLVFNQAVNEAAMRLAGIESWDNPVSAPLPPHMRNNSRQFMPMRHP